MICEHCGAASGEAATVCHGCRRPVTAQHASPSWRRYVRAPGEAPSPPSDGSWFVRHWRGWLSLPASYWLNFVVGSWLLVAIVTVVGQTVARHVVDHTVAVSVAIVVMWAVTYAASTWQIVGLWRSARRRVAVGRAGWARVAQATCIVAAVTDVAVLAGTAVPQLVMFGGLAVGIDELPPGDVRSVAGGREIHVVGPIGFGLTERVRRRLAEFPDARVVRLDSIGGRVAEAQRLRALIAERGVTTYSAAGCFSACTLAFLGGRARVLHRDADLGFHQYDAPGLAQWQMQDDYELDIATMTAAGVDEAFARRTFTAAHDDLWRPSHDELLQSHFVTAITDGSEFAVVAEDPSEWAMSFASGLETQRLYRVLAKREPTAYRDAMAEIERLVAAQETLGAVRAPLTRLIDAAVGRYVPRCPDAAIVSYTRAAVQEIAAMASADPERCWRVMFTPEGELEPTNVHDEVVAVKMDAIAECVEQAAERPARIPPPAGLSEALKRVLLRVRRKHGERIFTALSELRTESVDRGLACPAMVALYEEVLALPLRQAGAVLRGLSDRS